MIFNQTIAGGGGASGGTVTITNSPSYDNEGAIEYGANGATIKTTALTSSITATCSNILDVTLPYGNDISSLKTESGADVPYMHQRSGKYNRVIFAAPSENCTIALS